MHYAECVGKQENGFFLNEQIMIYFYVVVIIQYIPP